MASKSYVDLSTLVPAPFTTISNRAYMVDLANDLAPRLGTERIPVQTIERLQGETGPAGEPVFGATNDYFNQIRYVGDWNMLNDVSGSGYLYGGDTATYAEITFYGTDLNILVQTSSTANVVVDIDSAGEGSPIDLTMSNILLSRKTNPNGKINVVSGETLGIHTVKIRLNSAPGAIAWYGFEVINNDTQIVVNPGTSFLNNMRITKDTQELIDYASGFETGTLGTTGGRVRTYIKTDGTIGKALTPTDVAGPLYLTDANHANEDPTRTHHFREFGAGRSDDASLIESSPIDIAFTLDDNVTNLTGNNLRVTTTSLRTNDNTSFMTLTFVGTGLDVLRQDPAASTGEDFSVFVNNIDVGAMNSTCSQTSRIEKIVSGLPYGTHIVKIERTSAVQDIGILDFIVYGPKQPALPANTIDNGEYYINADFVVGTTGVNNISTGVIRKQNLREMIYENNWTLAQTIIDMAYVGGWRMICNAVESNISASCTFFGTGFDWRMNVDSDRATDVVATLDGVALTTANFPTATKHEYGNASFDFASTGVIDINDASPTVGGAGVSGLPLGLYTLKLNVVANTGSNRMNMGAIDVITPIYTPTNAKPGNIQSTFTVGNNSIGDKRDFTLKKGELPEDTPNYSEAKGLALTTTTSTTAVPLADMVCVIETTGKPIEIDYAMTIDSDILDSSTNVGIYVDGILVKDMSYNSPTAPELILIPLSDSKIVPVGAGTHIVQLFWNVTLGTSRTIQNSLSVKEIK